MHRLLLIIILLTGTAFSQSYFYVTPGGAGSKDGSNWSNALDWSVLMPAFTVSNCNSWYFMAGGSYNPRNVSSILWQLHCTAATQFHLVKAVDCTITNAIWCNSVPVGKQPQSVLGWNASFGTTVTSLIALKNDPILSSTTLFTFPTICGDYWSIDGSTPLSWLDVNGKPVTTGYGFHFIMPNPKSTVLGINGNGCAGTSITATAGNLIRSNASGRVTFTSASTLATWIATGQTVIVIPVAADYAIGAQDAGTISIFVGADCLPSACTTKQFQYAQAGADQTSTGTATAYFTQSNVTIHRVETDGVIRYDGTVLVPRVSTCNGAPVNGGALVGYYRCNVGGTQYVVENIDSNRTEWADWKVGTNMNVSSWGTNGLTYGLPHTYSFSGIGGTAFQTPSTGNGIALACVNGFGAGGIASAICTTAQIAFAQTGAVTLACPGADDCGSQEAEAMLEFPGGFAWTQEFGAQVTRNSVFTDNYFHDWNGDAIMGINSQNMDIERNFFQRTMRVTQPNHGNTIESFAGGGIRGNVGNPYVVAGNIFENPTGTEIAGTVGNAQGGNTEANPNAISYSDTAFTLHLNADVAAKAGSLFRISAATGCPAGLKTGLAPSVNGVYVIDSLTRSPNPVINFTIAGNVGVGTCGGTVNSNIIADVGVTGFQFVNNVAYCTTDFHNPETGLSPSCGVSRISGDNGAQDSILFNYIFTGNTLFQTNSGSGVDMENALPAGGAGCVINCGGSTGIAQNDLWFYDIGDDFINQFGVGSTVDHITIIDTLATAAHTRITDGVNNNSIITNVNHNAAATFSNVASTPYNFNLTSDTIYSNLNNGIGISGLLTDVTGGNRGAIGAAITRGAYAFVNPASLTLLVACGGLSTPASPSITSGGTISTTCIAGVASGVTSEAHIAGDNITLTAHPGTSTFTGWSGPYCNGSLSLTCSVTNLRDNITETATFQNVPTCGLSFNTSSINAPSLASATTVFTGVTGAGSLWFMFGPPLANLPIYQCLFPYSNCNANGQTGNIIPLGSGQYTGGACANNVCCTGSTAPLNVNNIGIGGFGH